MKTIILLRHAKSSWDNPDLADHDRPLNGRGRNDAPRMGRLLVQEGFEPDLFVSSTAKRAAMTAQLAADAAGYDGEIVLTRDLYHADPEAYLAIAGELDDAVDCVVMVGHNPGIEELAGQLSGHYERMPTAALAVFEVGIERWGELDGDDGRQFELKGLWLPKVL